MNFNQTTTDHINKVINEKLPSMIESHAEKMIEDIINDTFRWGDTKDSIKKKLQEAINVNLLEFDLIDYNALIAKTINENLIKQVNLQPIIDMTQDIIGFVNAKTITLYEISEMFISASQEEHCQDGEGEITFIVEENTEHNWIEVHADIEPDLKTHQCSVRFLFSTEGNRKGKIFSFKTLDRYYENFQREITPSRMINLESIQAKIFRLYSAQVQITQFDEQPSQYWDRY